MRGGYGEDVKFTWKATPLRRMLFEQFITVSEMSGVEAWVQFREASWSQLLWRIKTY